MGCCKAERYKWCEHEPVVAGYKDEQGNEYCIFHAPSGKKGPEPGQFNEQVFSKIRRAKLDNSLCNLSGTVFDRDMNFAGLELPRINFFEAEFSGEADFSRATFNREAYFWGATFSGKANFWRATFSGKASFSGATFSGEAGFEGATFSGKADFSEATFSEAAWFYSDTFIGEDEDTEINLQNLQIKNEIRFEKVNLKRVTFLDTDLMKIDFVNCDWIDEKGREKILYDEKRLSTPANTDSLKKVESLYRRLKLKCATSQNWPEVSIWHYGEKEMRRKRGARFWVTWLYWVSSGYAERPVRAAVWLGGLILGISLLMSFIELKPSADAPQWICDPSWGTRLLACFLNTLQYATFQKTYFFEPLTPFGSILKTIAQFLIPLQTALFILAVRNKHRR